MRWRTVVVAWSVCAGLALAYRALEPQATPAAPVEGPPVRAAFVGVPIETVREVHVRRQDRALAIDRANGGWRVASPANAEIAGGLVAAFVDALVETEIIEQFSAENDPSPYGLDARATNVEIVATDGGKVLLSIGGLNPTGTAVYARRSGSPHVVLIGRAMREYEDMLFRALPAPAVGVGGDGAVGR